MKIVNNKVVVEDNQYLVLYRHTDWEVFPEAAFTMKELQDGRDDAGRPILKVYHDVVRS